VIDGPVGTQFIEVREIPDQVPAAYADPSAVVASRVTGRITGNSDVSLDLHQQVVSTMPPSVACVQFDVRSFSIASRTIADLEGSRFEHASNAFGRIASEARPFTPRAGRSNKERTKPRGGDEIEACSENRPGEMYVRSSSRSSQVIPQPLHQRAGTACFLQAHHLSRLARKFGTR